MSGPAHSGAGHGRPHATLPPASIAEVKRLRSLYSLDLLDGDGHRFDRFGRIAAQTFDVPVALVTVLDDDHQWFCAAVGTELEGNVRSESFCTRLIDEDMSLLVVEDAQLDQRFQHLPIVEGEPSIRFYAGASVSSPEGQRIGTLCILDVKPHRFDEMQRQTLRDLADLVESEIHHLRLALTDDLTGLANRRAFMATTGRFLVLGARRGQPVTLIFSDIDGLKAVNDELGHANGDGLLRHAATTLTNAARPIDLVARIGGDEFALVMYNVDHEAAAVAVATLNDAVSASTSAAGLPPLVMSFGAATSNATSTLDDLIAHADGAMYDGRRNRADKRLSD